MVLVLEVEVVLPFGKHLLLMAGEDRVELLALGRADWRASGSTLAGGGVQVGFGTRQLLGLTASSLQSRPSPMIGTLGEMIGPGFPYSRSPPHNRHYIGYEEELSGGMAGHNLLDFTGGHRVRDEMPPKVHPNTASS